MIDVVRFSGEDLAELERIATERRAVCRAAGMVDHLFPDGSTGTLVRYDADGNRGECAVARSLGLAWRSHVLDTADPGYDLALPSGLLLDVKFTHYANGRLMVLEDYPITTPDALVLVVGTDDPRTVRIAGAITVAHFYATARTKDFGKGPTDYVEQAGLIPWPAFVELLEECW